LRSAAAVAAAAAALALAPAAAQAAVSADAGGKRCYAEGDTIAVSGLGYTPGGKIRLTLERAATGEVLEQSEAPTAEDDGSVSGGYGVDDETGWFSSSQSRFQMTLRLVDLTRLSQGRPADDPDVSATSSFIFSRWAIGVRTVGGRIHPKRPVNLNPVGFTNAVGKPLFGHWMRNGRRVFTKRLGTLRGPCGDLKTRLSRGFPFRPVRAGTYEVRFSPSRTNTKRSAIAVRAARVTRTIR
jgi:hypothetical protein